MAKTKFMQVLDQRPYRILRKLAKRRGITLQEMLRAVVIADWLEKNRVKK